MLSNVKNGLCSSFSKTFENALMTALQSKFNNNPERNKLLTSPKKIVGLK